jgi:hypothetical protein
MMTTTMTASDSNYSPTRSVPQTTYVDDRSPSAAGTSPESEPNRQYDGPDFETGYGEYLLDGSGQVLETAGSGAAANTTTITQVVGSKRSARTAVLSTGSQQTEPAGYAPETSKRQRKPIQRFVPGSSAAAARSPVRRVHPVQPEYDTAMIIDDSYVTTLGIPRLPEWGKSNRVPAVHARCVDVSNRLMVLLQKHSEDFKAQLAEMKREMKREMNDKISRIEKKLKNQQAYN